MTALTIRVRGAHELELPAERAEVTFAATGSGRDAATVTAGVSATASWLRAGLATLEAAGAVERWSSERLSTWTNHAGDDAEPTFTATISFAATFGSPDALGGWLGETATRSDVAVHGVQWLLGPATAEKAAADAATGAVDAAVERAERYARAAGRNGVRLVELADTDLSRGGPMPRMMMAASAPVDIELRPAPITVRAEVEAVFVSE